MEHTIVKPSGDWNGSAIVFLPGRGGLAAELLKRYADSPFLAQTMFIGIQPWGDWYPSPRGPKDQKEAVNGLKLTVQLFNEYVHNITKDLDRIAIVGFSAGGVVAIQSAAVNAWKYVGVISHSGCVLDPNILPKSKNDIPIHLYHAMNDHCFDWNERYIPTKKALSEKGYTVICHEKESGGHSLLDEDIDDAADVLSTLLRPK